MMVILGGVLAGDDLARVRQGLSAAPFADGRRTAGARAAKVKRNAQALGSDPDVQALERFVSQALCEHPVFAVAVRPKRLSRLLFSRYGAGDAYGRHTDDAVMGDPPLRTDVAFTLFLAEPGEYEGGELVIASPAGEQAVKLPAGSVVVYPAGSIHEVAPVTAGERLACVGWAQSLVRDPAQRELLFDLADARARLSQTSGLDTAASLKLDKVQAGLLRMWTEL